MARAYRRCSKCGRSVNAAGRGENNVRHTSEGMAESTAEAFSGSISPCGAANPVSAQLYGVICEPEIYAECCDPLCGCKLYNSRARNAFWPGFAHPRWLSCEELYNRCAL